jgi:hypothetical protein
MGLFIFVSSSVQKLEPKDTIFSGLPKKIEFFDQSKDHAQYIYV